MRVYHKMYALTAVKTPAVGLVSTCGHLSVSSTFDYARLERNGLMFYMQAHETKLQTIIKTILQKDA